MILDGLRVSLIITIFAALLGTILGGVLCWMRLCKYKWLQRLSTLYVNVVEGIPVLVLLMLMFYVFLSPLNVSGVLVAIITFGLNVAAYISELLRSAVQNIDRGQTEAGLALGHSSKQTFFRIILRQVVKSVLPVYQAEIVSLLKETSIVGYIAVVDMTRASDIIRSRTYEAFFPLILSAILYFIIAWFVGFLISGLSKKHYWRAGFIAAIIAVFCFADVWTPEKSGLFVETSSRPIRTVEDLENKRVVVQLGTEADFLAESYPTAREMMRVMTTPDAFQAVVSGRADYGFEDAAVILGAMHSGLPIDTLHFSDEKSPLGAMFNKNNTSLLEQFNDFLADIEKSGGLDSLKNKWLYANVDVGELPPPEQKKRDLQGTPIRIATEGAYFPYNFVAHGKPSGFEVELALMFGDAIDRPVLIDLVEFDAMVSYINANKGDMAIAGFIPTEERKNEVAFSNPYCEQNEMAFIKKYSEESEGAVNTSSLKWWVLCFALILLIACGWLYYHFVLNRKKKPHFVENPDGLLISVSHMQKSYNGLAVLRDMNLDIRKGEVVSIIGPSGTGKSTFLRCLNLLEIPTKGRISILGEDILAPDADVPKLRQKMGMVFQSFNLFNGMNILDNITMSPMKLLGKSREKAEAKARELLNMVGLGEKADVMPDQLSGGQKQRVAIARALAMDPEILLFDEPTSALDPTMVSEVLGVMTRLARNGITMIIVTHEMRFARLVSTRVLFFDEGIVYEDGTPEQVFENPQHEKTRKFIHQIHETTFNISSEQFDWFAMMAQMKNFCEQFNCSTHRIDCVEHLVEESLSIIGTEPGTSVTLAYTEKDGSSTVSIVTPKKIDPQILEKEENKLAVAVLRRFCSDIQIADNPPALRMKVC